MNTETILKMIERRKQHFISWKMDNGFIEAHKLSLSDKYETHGHLFKSIGFIFLYGFLGSWFLINFAEGNRILFLLVAIFIIISSFSTLWCIGSRIERKVNNKIKELLKTNELYSICEEKHSNDFYSQSLDITLKNSLKLHMNKDEWDLLRFYTHDKLTFGSLQKFLLHHKKMNLQSAPIDNDKLVIEATPIYSSVK